ncbi:MAG: GTPase, partial [Gaiellales bacterium]
METSPDITSQIREDDSEGEEFGMSQLEHAVDEDSFDPAFEALDEDDAAWIAAELAEQAELDADQATEFIGRVAVVGYPNVGKSTLVNRLSGTRIAIVHETAGVTRDRKEIECDWNGERFLLVDTGGVDEGDRSKMARDIVKQVEAAIGECDVVLLVVDSAQGVSAAD